MLQLCLKHFKKISAMFLWLVCKATSLLLRNPSATPSHSPSALFLSTTKTRFQQPYFIGPLPFQYAFSLSQDTHEEAPRRLESRQLSESTTRALQTPGCVFQAPGWMWALPLRSASVSRVQSAWSEQEQGMAPGLVTRRRCMSEQQGIRTQRWQGKGNHFGFCFKWCHNTQIQYCSFRDKNERLKLLNTCSLDGAGTLIIDCCYLSVQK